MNKFSYMLITVFLILNIGCSRLEKKKNVNNIILEDVPLELKDFFPKEISELYFIDGSLTPTMKYLSYFYYDFNLTHEKEILVDSIVRGKESFSSKDSLTIINESVVYPTDSVQNYFLIPFFEENSSLHKIKQHIFDNKNQTGLNEEFIFYHMGGESLVNIKDKGLNNYISSVGKKNGYIKGLAVNKESQTLIYYFVIF